MLKKFLFKESGQSMVLFALLLVVLIGFAGLVIDGGRLYIAKSELQKAVDAGVLAGADVLKTQFETNNNFDSITKDDAEKIANQVAKPIAEKNSTITYKPEEPSVDLSQRNQNTIYYKVHGETTVQLMLMPVLGIGKNTKVEAIARVKITKETIPGLSIGDIIPIGISAIPSDSCEKCKLVSSPGEGATGNYNFLNFSIIEPPEKTLTKEKCDASNANIDEKIITGPPADKPISINWHVCSKPGQSDTKIADAVNQRITDGKSIVYVPIITGYGTGTSPVTVVGFAAFELLPLIVTGKDHDPNHHIYGKFLKQVMPGDFIPIYSYKSKIDL